MLAALHNIYKVLDSWISITTTAVIWLTKHVLNTYSVLRIFERCINTIGRATIHCADCSGAFEVRNLAHSASLADVVTVF